MRAVFIGAGIALIQKFHWIIYIFGAKMLLVIVGLLAVAVVASLLHASRRREPTETANPSKASQPAEL